MEQINLLWEKSRNRKTEDEREKSLLRGMMLLDTRYIPDFVLEGFSEEREAKYREQISKCCSEKQKNILQSAVEYVLDAMGKREDCEEDYMFVPFLLYLADLAEDEEIPPTKFGSWWKCFTADEKYSGICETLRKGRAADGEAISSVLDLMQTSMYAHTKRKL